MIAAPCGPAVERRAASTTANENDPVICARTSSSASAATRTASTPSGDRQLAHGPGQPGDALRHRRLLPSAYRPRAGAWPRAASRADSTVRATAAVVRAAGLRQDGGGQRREDGGGTAGARGCSPSTRGPSLPAAALGDGTGARLLDDGGGTSAFRAGAPLAVVVLHPARLGRRPRRRRPGRCRRPAGAPGWPAPVPLAAPEAAAWRALGLGLLPAARARRRARHGRRRRPRSSTATARCCTSAAAAAGRRRVQRPPRGPRRAGAAGPGRRPRGPGRSPACCSPGRCPRRRPVTRRSRPSSARVTGRPPLLAGRPGDHRRARCGRARARRPRRPHLKRAAADIPGSPRRGDLARRAARGTGELPAGRRRLRWPCWGCGAAGRRRGRRPDCPGSGPAQPVAVHATPAPTAWSWPTRPSAPSWRRPRRPDGRASPAARRPASGGRTGSPGRPRSRPRAAAAAAPRSRRPPRRSAGAAPGRARGRRRRGPRAVRLGQRRDEGPVELDGVDGQVPQACERAVPGAEVVDGDADPAGAGRR